MNEIRQNIIDPRYSAMTDFKGVFSSDATLVHRNQIRTRFFNCSNWLVLVYYRMPRVHHRPVVV